MNDTFHKQVRTIGNWRIITEHLYDHGISPVWDDCTPYYVGVYRKEKNKPDEILVPSNPHNLNEPMVNTRYTTSELKSYIASDVAAGMSKKDAVTKWSNTVKRMVKIANEFASGDRYYIGISITIEYAGIELAQDSLWGIEYSHYDKDSESYIKEIEQDCFSQAKAQARSNLKTIKAKLSAISLK